MWLAQFRAETAAFRLRRRRRGAETPLRPWPEPPLRPWPPQARIKYITEHVINNPKDHATRRGLLALVSKRRRLLNYYYKVAPAKAEQLTADLGIRFRFKSALPSRTEKYRQYTIAANRRNK